MSITRENKILLISPLPPPDGGIAIWTSRYLNWANNNNLVVELVNTSVVGKRANNINSNRSLIDEVRRSIKILGELMKKLRHYNPSVVHLNTACGRFGIVRDYLCAKLVTNMGIPLITHYRCNIKDQVNGGYMQKRFLSRLAKLTTVNLVLNTCSEKYLKEVSSRSSILVPNFIDEGFLIQEKKDINKEIKKAVFVGHVKSSKGVKEIIETAKHFSNIDFILAGPVSREIELMETPENVIFKGPVNQSVVKELLLTADIFVFPTYSEGFSNALLEAMANGVPIITTRVGANQDMIESFGGILVRTRNTDDIVQAILDLEDIGYRKRISKWNINKVNNHYTINKVMSKLIQIYNMTCDDEAKDALCDVVKQNCNTST